MITDFTNKDKYHKVQPIGPWSGLSSTLLGFYLWNKHLLIAMPILDLAPKQTSLEKALSEGKNWGPEALAIWAIGKRLRIAEFQRIKPEKG